MVAAEDGPLSNVAMPVSTGVTCEMGLVDVKDIVPDQAACIVSEALWSNCKVTHLYFLKHFPFLTHPRVRLWRIQWIHLVEWLHYSISYLNDSILSY